MQEWGCPCEWNQDARHTVVVFPRLPDRLVPTMQYFFTVQLPVGPGGVSIGAGKELFVGELLVIIQGKLAKKTLPVRAHDRRFDGTFRGQVQPEVLQITRERHGTGKTVMGQDEILIPDPDLSLPFIEDGLAVIADIHSHQRGAIVDRDIVPLGIQPGKHGQGLGVQEECTGRLLGHLLQIERTQDEAAVEAGDGTKEIVKEPVRKHGAVPCNIFQFGIREEAAAIEARPSSPAEQGTLRIARPQYIFSLLAPIRVGVGQHTAKCQRALCSGLQIYDLDAVIVPLLQQFFAVAAQEPVVRAGDRAGDVVQHSESFVPDAEPAVVVRRQFQIFSGLVFRAWWGRGRLSFAIAQGDLAVPLDVHDFML